MTQSFVGFLTVMDRMAIWLLRELGNSLPQKLNAQWEVNTKSEEVLREISLNCSSVNSEEASFISADEESRVSVDLEETDKEPEIFEILKESFLKAFRIMDRELRVHVGVDCFCSGTTAVTLIKQVAEQTPSFCRFLYVVTAS